MPSEKVRTAIPRVWKCENCGFVNQINLRRKIIRATYLCIGCKEHVYVYDKKGELQYPKGSGVLTPVSPSMNKH